MNYKQWLAKVHKILEKKGIDPNVYWTTWKSYFNCNYTPEAAIYDVFNGTEWTKKDRID